MRINRLGCSAQGGVGLELLPVGPKARQCAALGGHFCQMDVYVMFHCVDLHVVSFALGFNYR